MSLCRAEVDRKKMESSLFKAQQSHLRVLTRQAENHYRSQLLIRCGWAPWMRLLELSLVNSEKATAFRADWLRLVYWGRLVGYWRAVRTEFARREFRLSAEAVAQYKRFWLRLVFTRMKRYRKILRAKAVAVSNQFSR
jgi:hypothetical protein